MTLDITIGKLVVDPNEEYGYERAYGGIDPHHTDVDPCPDADVDICDPECTIYPRRSYRSGAYGSLPQFIQLYLPRMRRELGVCGIARLSRYYNEIQAMSDDASLSGHNIYCEDRIKWFKYWSKKAKELYGDAAGISFS